MKVLSRLSIPSTPVHPDEPTSKQHLEGSLQLVLNGDVTGVYNANHVERIRGRNVSADVPEPNNSLVWRGSQWQAAWPWWPGIEEAALEWDVTSGSFHTAGTLYIRRALPTNQATIVANGNYVGTGWTADCGTVANTRLRPTSDQTLALQWPGSGTAVSMVIQPNGLIYLFNSGTSDRTGMSFHTFTTVAV